MNQTDQIISQLKAEWSATRGANYAYFERLYGGDHPWEDVVSKAMRNQRDADGDEEFKRFWKPANMAYIVVEEAVGYWSGAKVELQLFRAGERDHEASKTVTAQVKALFNSEREEIARSQALYGEGVLRVRTPSKGRLKGYAASPYNGGPWCMTFCEDPDDPYRVTTCVYLFVRENIVWAQHLTAEKLDLYKVATVQNRAYPASVSPTADAQVFVGMGQLKESKPNPWGVVPVYSFNNGSGASDLFPMVNAQHSLNKAIYNLEAAAEYHGFPLLEVRGYVGRRDDDGRPIDLDVGPGSYVDVDVEGGVRRLDAAKLGDLLAAEARGYLRVAQQARSPSVLMEYGGLGDSGRVPAFLLEPLKMRLNSKKTGSTHPLELLARDLPRYGLEGALDLDDYDVQVEITMPLPSDKIGEEESMARGVEVGSRTRQSAARWRGEDPERHLLEWERELSIQARVQESAKAEFAPKPAPAASKIERAI